MERPAHFLYKRDEWQRNQELSIEHWAGIDSVCMAAHECVYLRQAEGDASSCHSVVGLDCEHKLVIGRGLHSHMSAETGDSWLVLVLPCIIDVMT